MIKAHQGWIKVSFDLVVSVVIPVIILTRLSGEQQLGPAWGLVVALIFPAGLGLYDFGFNKNYNLFSILGFISVLLTGGIGLLKLNPVWIAAKEASIPLVIGLVILGSLKTPWPVVKTRIGKILNTAQVHRALTKRGVLRLYEARLVRATYLFAGSFFLSAALNYILAKIIVVSQPGTVSFNEELGRLTALSYPVIALPSFIIFVVAIWYVVVSLQQLTYLELDQLVKSS